MTKRTPPSKAPVRASGILTEKQQVGRSIRKLVLKVLLLGVAIAQWYSSNWEDILRVDFVFNLME